MKKQIIVTMLLAATLGTVSPSMKAEAKWRADANGRNTLPPQSLH